MQKKRATHSTFKKRKIINKRLKEFRKICDNEGFIYSAVRARRALQFAKNHIKHVKGEFAGQPFILEPWQRKIIKRVFGWLHAETATRVIREVWIEIPRKNGKALSIETDIPTPSGFKKMKDLVIGDYVYDENGQPTKITNATEILYNRDCYELTFSNGAKVICDADHDWLVHNRRKERQIVMSTKDIAKEDIDAANGKNFSISNCGPLRSNKINLSIIKIQKIKSVPVRCIEVENPKSLYLCSKYFIPTHNSFLGAFFALFLLFADKEDGAEVVSAAADTEQGALVYDVAKQIVIQDPVLNRMCKTYKKTMAVYSTASKYAVISAEAYTKHGKNLSGIVADEVHAQPDRELLDVLTTSTSARRQPLTVYLTTAGYDKNSICFEKHEYARKLIEGIIVDYAFYPVIFAADIKDDWTDQKTWFKANPNLGISKRLEYMKAECEKAKKEPAYENTFKRLELNIWTEQDVRWIPMHEWDQCDKAINLNELVKIPCNGGLDLSTSTDLTCFSLVFPSENSLSCDFTILPFFFIPEEMGKKNPYYKSLLHHNEIILTPGNVLDYTFVEEKILELSNIFNIIDIGYDPWNATQITQRLTAKGLEMIPIRQGFASMSPPSKEFLNLILQKRIKHGANHTLRWNASNVTVELDAAGNIKPSKKKSTQRIDGIVASIMGLDRAIRTVGDAIVIPEEGIRSV